MCVVLVFLGCEGVGVHGFSFRCISSFSYMCLVLSSVGVVCCVTLCFVCCGERCVFYVLCRLWCLLGVLLVFVLVSWCVMCVTVFCLVFVGFVFLDSTNLFFVSYVTIFCVC